MFGINKEHLIILPFILIIYFIPAMVSTWRKHSKDSAISMLNLFAGWTFIGWVVALVWACTEYNRGKTEANLFNCIDCGKEISIRATACPHCGAPNKNALPGGIRNRNKSEKTLNQSTKEPLLLQEIICSNCHRSFPSRNRKKINNKILCPLCAKNITNRK